MITTLPPIRMDRAGSGEFGAPRGDRKHYGVDYCAQPGSVVLAPCSGFIIKVGRPYADDINLKYVDFQVGAQITLRYMYCETYYTTEPLTLEGDFESVDFLGTGHPPIKRGHPLARVQDVTQRHPDSGMLPHVHIELLYGPERHRIDPGPFLEYLNSLPAR